MLFSKCQETALIPVSDFRLVQGLHQSVRCTNGSPLAKSGRR